MLIRADQLRGFWAPLRCHIALADQTFRLDFENISEISPQRQFEREAYLPHAVIANLEILMKTIENGAVQNQTQGPWLNLVVLSCDSWIREVGT